MRGAAREGGSYRDSFGFRISDFNSLGMDLKFENKTALVTASTAGIGFAIALELAREGARVVVSGAVSKSENQLVKDKEKLLWIERK